jgi:hypothetical protein
VPSGRQAVDSGKPPRPSTGGGVFGRGGVKLSGQRRTVQDVGLADWLELTFMALVTVNYVAFPKPGRGRYLVAILLAGAVAIIT